MPDLTTQDAIYDVVSNMETPEMTMVANGNRRQLGRGAGSAIIECPNNQLFRFLIVKCKAVSCPGYMLFEPSFLRTIFCERN
jgi:hypothetical protein